MEGIKLKQYILTAEHIEKKYAGNKVLQDVSIHVKQGDIYGLIGKNGSGKTTLLRIVTGLIPCYGGIVDIGEIDNGKCTVSAVIDAPSLFLNLTAFENMKEQSYLLGIYDQTKIKGILKTVDLSDCNNKLVKNFSLGMTQRLKLGMALLRNPDILILDEPINGLDPDGIADLRKLLSQLKNEYNMTILISSHILSELEQVATCFGILHNGKIVKEVSVNEILQEGKTLEELYMQHTKGGE
jgi:ABC-type multidrug transport system ATPase subunit